MKNETDLIAEARAEVDAEMRGDACAVAVTLPPVHFSDDNPLAATLWAMAEVSEQVARHRREGDIQTFVRYPSWMKGTDELQVLRDEIKAKHRRYLIVPDDDVAEVSEEQISAPCDDTNRLRYIGSLAQVVSAFVAGELERIGK